MITFNNTPKFDCGGECHNFSANIGTRGFCANCPITSRALMQNSTGRCVSEDLKRVWETTGRMVEHMAGNP